MNKKLIMIVSIIVTSAILISTFSLPQVLSAGDSKSNKYEMNEAKKDVLLMKDSMELSLNYKQASIYFGVNNGCIYKSIPDEEISGPSRMAALSMVSINVINDKGEMEQYYSYSDCVQNGNYKVYSGEEQIRIDYQFEKVGVMVPVEFAFDGDNSFKVTVPIDEVKDDNKQLVDISILPYMGAAHTSQQGYILVPDGSGAAVEFNNGKSNYGNSSYTVYGTDAMDNKEYVEIDKNAVNLPMFAFMYEGVEPNAMVAYITQGDALASLNISVSSANNPYNIAYYKFNYRPYTLATILDRTNEALKVYIASKDTVECDNFEVKYTHFSNEKATLSSVADYVAGYVFGEREKKEETTQSAFLDVYASVYKRVYTLGVPHQANVALTTLEDATKIAKDFENPIMLLRGLDKYGAISGTIDSRFDISKTVGNTKDYKLLSEKATLYNYCEFTRFDKNSLGAFKVIDSARSVTGKVLNTYYYNPATLLSEQHTHNLLNPLKIEKKVNSYLKSLDEDIATGIAPISLGNSPYTHNTKSDRQKTLEVFCGSLQQATETDMQILLYNPDGFALKYADTIMNLPTQSSKQCLIDYDIPFIQMVVRDYVNYSGEAVNISGNMNDAILNAAKTGSNLCFAITNSNYKQIKDTEMDFLYNADYSRSGERFVETYNEYTERMSKTVNGRIINCAEIAQGVFVTKFDNGASVYVNYNDEEYKLESGEVIQANDFSVFEEGKVE